MKTFKPSITYRQIEKFARSAARIGAQVGECNHPTRCLVAEAILHKYPQLTGVWVGFGIADDGSYNRTLSVYATEKDPSTWDQTEEHGYELEEKFEYKWEAVIEDGNDADRIHDLIRSFDALYYGGPVPAKYVVKRLFTEQAA